LLLALQRHRDERACKARYGEPTAVAVRCMSDVVLLAVVAQSFDRLGRFHVCRVALTELCKLSD
jgi:hypothetical protein